MFNCCFRQIIESEFEEKAKEQVQRRRVTIATETPAKELSPHYATKLEKQAFMKIREWKEGFAIKLDQVLQQRQCPDNKAKSISKDDGVTDWSLPALPSNEDDSYTIPSSPHTTKPKAAPEDFGQDTQKQLLTELRGVSEMSVRGMSDMNGCDTGSRILQQIKKQRKHGKGLGENKKLMEDLSSWHRLETGRITNDLCSCTSDSQDVKRLLASLKETIDAIFVTTIQRVSDFVVSSSSTENNINTERSYDALNQKALLKWQLKNTQGERDSLFLENISLKKEIADLRSQLAEVSERNVELTSRKGDAVKLSCLSEHTDIGNCVRIEEIQKAIDRLKECAGYELDLQDMDERLDSGKNILIESR